MFKITAYSEHADLIITDQHEKISDETETFYLDTTHNTVLFGKLIKAVHELYMKKGYENKEDVTKFLSHPLIPNKWYSIS